MELNLSWWYTAPWLAMITVWVIGALGSKSTARSEPAARRAGHMFLVILGALLFFTARAPAVLVTRVVPDTLAIFWLGVALTWIGIAFAIWARWTLGRNWSGMV